MKELETRWSFDANYALQFDPVLVFHAPCNRSEYQSNPGRR